MSFREFKVRRNPKCPMCGDQPTIKQLIDYEQFCGVRGQETPAHAAGSPAARSTVEELKQRLDRGEKVFILDVRNPEEFQICRIPGSTLLPLPALPQRFGELDRDREMVVHCKSGMRSQKAIAVSARTGLHEAEEPQGRHPGVGGSDRSGDAEVLGSGRRQLLCASSKVFRVQHGLAAPPAAPAGRSAAPSTATPGPGSGCAPRRRSRTSAQPGPAPRARASVPAQCNFCDVRPLGVQVGRHRPEELLRHRHLHAHHRLQQARCCRASPCAPRRPRPPGTPSRWRTARPSRRRRSSPGRS